MTIVVLSNAVYHAVDTPEAALSGWWEAIWHDVQSLLKRGPTVVLLDEIQYLGKWDRLMKAKADQLQREKWLVNVALSGSSALLVGRGLKETMAGRFEKLRLLHWSAADLQAAFGLAEHAALDYLVRRGSYPGAFPLREDAARWRAYVRDSIIEPAIGRDILMMEPVRKPALLRQVFAIAAAHPAEIVSLHKLAGLLAEQGTMATIAHYLSLLGQAHLVAAVGKFARGEVRRRAAPPKLIPLSNAFLAAAEEGPLPEAGRDPARWGRWVENACLAFAINRGQTVHYWREEPREVDAVVEGS